MLCCCLLNWACSYLVKTKIRSLPCFNPFYFPSLHPFNFKFNCSVYLHIKVIIKQVQVELLLRSRNRVGGLPRPPTCSHFSSLPLHIPPPFVITVLTFKAINFPAFSSKPSTCRVFLLWLPTISLFYSLPLSVFLSFFSPFSFLI